VIEARQNTSRSFAAVILAAGRGTRMKGDLPKVAHEVAGRPMIRWVVDACRRAGARPIVLVVGHGADLVRSIFANDGGDLAWATQEKQLGTGHAAACAREALRGFGGDVVVLAGDGPLIRASTIARLLAHHRRHRAAATLATSTIEDPTGYGRIVRDAQGRFQAIVEHASATEAQRAIREVYPSYACFDAAALFPALAKLSADAASGEYRITDAFTAFLREGRRVEVFDGLPPEEVLSINTPAQLEEVSTILSARPEEAA
jgi:bifunctional UDP-N-acetylglucosamine pyrophosphorylase/glucosamine-1-phosphate N-acetyltransferase